MDIITKLYIVALCLVILGGLLFVLSGGGSYVPSMSPTGYECTDFTLREQDLLGLSCDTPTSLGRR